MNVFEEVKELCLYLNFGSEASSPYGYKIGRLLELVKEMPDVKVEKCQSMLIATVYRLFTASKSLDENNKILVINTLSEILRKLKFYENDAVIFFNLYGFLLQQICDPKEINSVQKISEEYKLAIIQSSIILMNTFSWELSPIIYKKENVPKLGAMVHLCLKLAQHEKLRQLRISSIECILAMAKLDSEDVPDFKEEHKVIADVFMYFLPAMAAGLVGICIEDEKCGHTVVVAGLRAWSRLVTLSMKTCDNIEDNLNDVLKLPTTNSGEFAKQKCNNDNDIKNYLDSMKRTSDWYAQQDSKLKLCMDLLMKLTTSQHPKIREELVTSCDLLTLHCLSTLPKTASKAIEIFISLSEDEYQEVAARSNIILYRISEKISDDSFRMKTIREIMEQNFYNTVTKLPRVFNGLDEREQLTALNLIIGYLSIFQKNRLKQILFTYANLNRLILSLIHVATLKTTDVNLLEEYSTQGLEINYGTQTPWKVFNFHGKNIEARLEFLCSLLAQPDISEIVLDFLVDIYNNDVEHRKEATLIINGIVSSMPCDSQYNVGQMKLIISLYLEKEFWQLPLKVIPEENITLGEVQNNIVQICLQIEGIGKMALALNDKFREFLLKVLYAVLEKAGSGNFYLRVAGLAAITNISKACNYKNVTELIKENSDYFSYHVVRQLKRIEHDEGVLNVLAVVMRHSDMDVLPSISEIIDGVLVQSCDKYELKNTSAYLKVFKIFIKCLHKWLDVNIKISPMVTKEEREKEMEDFKLSNLEALDTDFSDEAVMGKSADELWTEDMGKSENHFKEEMEPEVQEYKQPDPPMHIQLTVAILKRSLNFLPSKDMNLKILSLEILKEGVEILHDWEDVLLPIVHLIWSPLVNRFKEFHTPLIINLSFQLLTKLATLSKEFIRSRTITEVLPSLSEALYKQSKMSHLKDKGSVYRYSQGYKMQLSILPQLGRLCYDIDMSEKGIKDVLDVIKPYLSSRQPSPLQEAAVEFYKTLLLIDSSLGERSIKELEGKNERYNGTNNVEYNKNCTLIVDYMNKR